MVELYEVYLAFGAGLVVFLGIVTLHGFYILAIRRN